MSREIKRRKTSALKGRKQSEELKIKRGAYNKREKHFNWSGGITYTSEGYVRIYQAEHPSASNKYVLLHRLMMEKEIGRYLKRGEIVHHINGDIKDNRIENLELFANQSEHMKYHRRKQEEANHLLKGDV